MQQVTEWLSNATTGGFSAVEWVRTSTASKCDLILVTLETRDKERLTWPSVTCNYDLRLHAVVVNHVRSLECFLVLTRRESTIIPRHRYPRRLYLVCGLDQNLFQPHITKVSSGRAGSHSFVGRRCGRINHLLERKQITKIPDHSIVARPHEKLRFDTPKQFFQPLIKFLDRMHVLLEGLF